MSHDALFANGREFKLDCLIYATGFELSPFEQGAPIHAIGRDGITLAEKWQDGATTMHAMHVHGFPNLMISGTRQGPWDNNFPFPQESVASHIAYIVRTARERRIGTLEVTADAEANWVKFHELRAERLLAQWRDCTPSYFNNEGKPSAAIARNGAFGGGILEFRQILQNWREAGDLAGLTQVSEVTAV